MEYIVGIDEAGRAARKASLARNKWVVGIDEVGRGSLAGPVVVAAVCMPKGLVVRVEGLGKLRDSKKLTSRLREKWNRYFRDNPYFLCAVAQVYPKTIDRVNISRAANLAALRAYRRLVQKLPPAKRKHSIFLDGGLYLGRKGGVSRAKTVVKGDEKISAIKIASIVAKVSRDRLMRRLAKGYPRYGFEIHKGYGTKLHLRALKRHGPSKAHRLTFLRFS